MRAESSSAVLARWSSYGRLMRSSDSGKMVGWEAAQAMISILRNCAEAEAMRLRSYLSQSDTALKPLGEPLLSDFGLHRWLKREREESYSDWLAWIVEQLSDDPELAFRLFGLARTDFASTVISVDRETPVRLVSEESAKRLDLLIRLKDASTGIDRELYIVEVKITDPESADTAKQRDYYDWLKQQPVIKRGAVLVALEGAEGLYEGFRLFTWTNLCIELRTLVQTILVQTKPIAAALVLAFVGAVEQNLCGLSARQAQEVARGRVPLITTDIADHLERFLTRCSHDVSQQ